MVVSEHMARGRNHLAATWGQEEKEGVGQRREIGGRAGEQPDGDATSRHIGVEEIGGPAAGGIPEGDPSHQHRGDREAGEMFEDQQSD